jgi:hypothetical protein
MLKRRFLVVSAALLLGGCSFQTNVPSDKEIACSDAPGAAPCPDGYTCRAALGRCVLLSEISKPQAGIASASASPSIGNANTSFVASFSVTEALGKLPNVYGSAFAGSGNNGTVGNYPFICDSCSPAATCSCHYTPDPANLPPEGPLEVRIEVVDAEGNTPPPVSAGTVLLDFTPPDLEANSSDITFDAPPGVSVPVSALGPAGSMQVCFTANEPLGQLPKLWLAANVESQPKSGDLVLSVVDGYPQGLRNCFAGTLEVDAGMPDGARHLLAQLQDLAGNVAVREIGPWTDGGPTVLLDSTPPPAPDTSQANGLRYRRAPFGDMSSPGTPSFSLSSSGSALAEDGYLLVYEDAAGRYEVARGSVTAGALNPPLPLLPPDRPEVYVSLFDRAGNVSGGGPVRVQNVDYVATLAGKIAGDTVSNPHACYARAVQGPALIQADDPLNEQGADTGPTLTDGGLVVVSGQATWHQRWPAVSGINDTGFFDIVFPFPMAYDSARARLVAIIPTMGRQTWFFDGRDWAPASGVQIEPLVGDGAEMVYDSARDRIVLFGGDNGVSLCNTWEFDGTVWRVVATCNLADGGTSGPPPRMAAAMAYDADRQRTVMFDGLDDFGNQIDDAWEWDGTHWTPMANSSGDGGLPPHFGSSLVFGRRPDGSGALFHAGGWVVASTNVLNLNTSDTWLGVWNDGGYVWSPEGGSICPASNASCTTVLASNDPGGVGFWKLVQDPSLAEPTQVFSWNGLPDAGFVAIGSVSGAGQLMGFQGVPSRAEALVYAIDANQAFGDEDPSVFVCAEDGGCSRVHDPRSPPLKRAYPGLAFDRQGRGLLAYGETGSSALSNGQNTTDNFLWNGDDWIPVDTGPSGRFLAGLAYLPAAQSFLLVGGEDAPSGTAFDDLWRYSVTGGWTQLNLPSGLTDPDPPLLAFVPDAGSSDALFMPTSTAASALLTWDESQQQVEFTNRTSVFLPGIGEGDSVVYDQLRSTAVFLTWDGQLFELGPQARSWTGILSGTAPAFSRPIYDEYRQRLYLTGLDPNGSELPGEIWTWDGSSMVSQPFADPEGDGAPAYRLAAGFANDPARHQALLFGGVEISTNTYLDDTWELRESNLDPAEVCQFRFDAAHATGATMTAIEVDVLAGADGPTGPAGTSLQLYLDGAWREQARCDDTACGLSSPTVLSFQTTDPTIAERLIQLQNTLGVALTPLVPNGPGTARVGVSTLQAIFSYRLP